jgi:hypothetical protein
VAELRANLDQADRIQREEYPVVRKASRLELFPELRHSGRVYTQAWEEAAWSLSAVEMYLAEYMAIRKVSRTGHVTVYDHGHYVGRQHQGQSVQVQYDPDRHQWLISNEKGGELRRHPAPEITVEQIFKLTFRKKRKES